MNLFIIQGHNSHSYNNNGNNNSQSHNNQDCHCQPFHPKKEINLKDTNSIILEFFMGSPARDSSKNAHKSTHHQAISGPIILEVTKGKYPNLTGSYIIFFERESHSFIHSHVDFMAVTLQMANITLHRILKGIDNSNKAFPSFRASNYYPGRILWNPTHLKRQCDHPNHN